MYFGDAARILQHAGQLRLRVAAIFHDAIPISHPHLVDPDTVNEHPDYMRALTRADALLPVSRESSNRFLQFATDNGLPPPRQVTVCHEPAEMLGVRRVTEPQTCDPGAINLLCVSTLEPRKNHMLLID